MPSSYSVVEQVYLEPDGATSLDWQAQAACAGNDTDVFFPWGGNTPADLLALCGSCPVTETCREYALERDWITGVWGGTTRAQRDEIRRRRAAGLPDEPENEPRCRNGHVLDEANAYRRSDGRGIRCRQCVRDYWHVRQARKGATSAALTDFDTTGGTP